MPDSSDSQKPTILKRDFKAYWSGINVSRDLPLEKSPLRICATKFPGARSPDPPEREQDRLKDALAALDMPDTEEAERKARLAKTLCSPRGENVPADLAQSFLDE